MYGLTPFHFFLFTDSDYIVAVIAGILKRMQEEQMKNRDKRTRLMSELLSNIKRFATGSHRNFSL